MKQFGLMFGFVGLAFLIAATWLFIDHQQFVAASKMADATVIGIEIVHADEGDSYLPVFEFRLENGDKIFAHPNITLSPPYAKGEFIVGQKMKIRYDPRDPPRIYLLSFFENWGLMIIFGGLALILLSIGIGAFRRGHIDAQGK